MYFYLLALAITLTDQLVKLLVHSFMQLGQSFPLLDGIVKLTYVRNTGAAFSLFVGFSPYLAVISLIIIAAVIYFYYRLKSEPAIVQTGLAFILGGSLGNLADRIFRSYVIDYIDFGFWPVFNLADTMINIGVLLLVIRLFAGGKKDASDPL